MIRLFVLSWVYIVSLNAIEGPTQKDFQACYAKNQQAYVTLYGVEAVAISKDKAVAFAGKKQPTQYVKYDPFLNLYLLHSSTPLKPVRQRNELKMMHKEWLGSVLSTQSFIGKFDTLSTGTDFYDKSTAKTPKGSIITCTCCDMYGIGAENGRYIGNRYLNHFIAYDDVYYGDVGVRFEYKNNKIYVKEIDPFVSKDGFQVGDEVVQVDSKPIGSFRAFKERILFAKKGTMIRFTLKGKKESIVVPIVARNVVTPHLETFLEHKGMTFSPNLEILSIQKESMAAMSGLKKGDRLLEVDGKPVKNTSEVRALFSLTKAQSYYLLFERQGFQFFVKIVQ